MSLLQTILDGAIDPGYRRAASQPTKPQPLWRRAAILVAAALLMFFATLAVKNLRFEQTNEATIHTRIVDQIETRQKAISGLVGAVEDLDAQLQTTQSGLIDPTGQIDPAAAVGSAFAKVSGPGVAVTLVDSEALTNQNRGIVRDSDVRQFVNVLWQAGAEAIEINGTRLGPMTTIRAAGSVVLINLEPVTSPYEILAIGDSAALTQAISADASGVELRELGAKVGFSYNVERFKEATFSAVAPQGRITDLTNDNFSQEGRN